MKKKTNMKPKNRMKDACNNYLHLRIKQVLPYIYSAMALALWNVLDETEDEKVEDIATLISESQEIWTECVNSGRNIVEWCEEVTGFDIKGSVS